MKSSVSNIYLEEVLQKEEEQTTPPIDIRITGGLFRKRVVVPPNVYVVHTRQGRTRPVNIGLGISFRYNPNTDAFLVIPATMQTILINARCICQERQGILVQAYVQWIIDDIETAYRRLDFSNTLDPMVTVREQLREQAEAIIKDKVSTMSIDEVLADKRAIMVEMTNRLREVAEGTDSGLGLKIVTVQIKEAVISSARLWEHLQKPFRAEKEQAARLAEIERERVLSSQEQRNHAASERDRIATEEELSKQRAEQEATAFDRESKEEERRQKARQESEQRRIEREAVLEQQRAEQSLEARTAALQREVRMLKEQQTLLEAQLAHEEAQQQLLTLQAQNQAAIAEIQSQAESQRTERELSLERTRREVDNLVSQERIQERLIELLPEIAQTLPTPEHLEQIQFVGAEEQPQAASLVTLISSLRSLFQTNSHKDS